MGDFIQLVGGGALLYIGAEWLVGGASSIALSLRVPQLIVGLTVVAYGTSAPELVVGMEAAAGGHAGVALGNIIGSNIANLGLILGLAALIRPTPVQEVLRRRELPVLLISTALVPLVLAWGRINRIAGGLLVAGAALYTFWMMRSARSAAGEAALAAAAEAEAAGLARGETGARGRGRMRHVVGVICGLAMLILGGRLLVDAATSLALTWGMSERMVGLTVVAIGTSLPELATSVIAALRGHADLAVGNVVGSNIFNVLLCLGGAALVRPIPASLAGAVPDLVSLGIVTALAVLFLRSARTMTRTRGAGPDRGLRRFHGLSGPGAGGLSTAAARVSPRGQWWYSRRLPGPPPGRGRLHVSLPVPAGGGAPGAGGRLLQDAQAQLRISVRRRWRLPRRLHLRRRQRLPPAAGRRWPGRVRAAHLRRIGA